MTQTMRERLEAVAARTATVDCEGEYEVDNWPEVIDAILAELRVPDDAECRAVDAALKAFDPTMGLMVRTSLHIEVRKAMIDAVREGK